MLLGFTMVMTAICFWFLFANSESRPSRRETKTELGSRLGEDRDPQRQGRETPTADALSSAEESSSLAAKQPMILGCILDQDGKAVAGLTVELISSSAEAPNSMAVNSPASRRTVTDEGGNYALFDQPAGQYEVGIQSEDYWDQRLPSEKLIRLSSGVTTELKFEVTENCKIEGAVVGRYGAGLRTLSMDALAIDPGGILAAERESADRGASMPVFGLAHTRGFIDSAGRFRIERLDGRFYYRIRVFETGAASDGTPLEIGEECERRDNLDALLIMNGISVGSNNVVLEIN